MADTVRVLIVDDHAIVREGLSLILETNPGLEVVGEAEDGREALDLAATLKPDVILMDLRMPGMDGLTALRHLQAEQPQIAVVILTTYNEDKLMLQGLQSGAQGYLLKDTGRATLIETIQAAARGDTLISPEILARALAAAGTATETSQSAPSPQSSPRAAVEPAIGPALSEREMAVLQAAAQGERNKEIARQLNISERTVKAHLTSVYNKLGVDSRAEAVAVAMRAGWI